ncbi:Flagellar protein FlaG [hydrothermal vent metagenome]|uniref:Flagellar protein FlaG n=1 Tax=hydrothermal vent metagenome TaxID=652676 RepID=A0A3B0XI94_9ZZZZ
MANDIITNQLSKDVPKLLTAAKPTEANSLQNRQEPAVETGKTLPPETENKQVNREELEVAVITLNERVQQIQRDLLFSVDDSSGRTVVRVVNTETEEVVRQIPSEEVLRISRNIQDQLDDVTGLIFETSS